MHILLEHTLLRVLAQPTSCAQRRSNVRTWVLHVTEKMVWVHTNKRDNMGGCNVNVTYTCRAITRAIS